ncbi:MAG: amidophosphoribosyltransferase [Patescibacteria group bacterium]
MCGILAIANHDRSVAEDLYVGLINLQHRGKESAGMAVSSPAGLVRLGGMGEVPQAFWSQRLDVVRGNVGIGQTRYSTAGDSSVENIQPVRGRFGGREFYLVHNGNLVNVSELQETSDALFNCSDTQVIANAIGRSTAVSFEDALLEVVRRLLGSFNLILLFDHKIYVIMDPFGFHPLQVGERPDGFIVASESCVFDSLGARTLWNVQPGEFLIIDEKQIRHLEWTTNTRLQLDIFEFIYFLRPDSIVHGVEAGRARTEMGRMLANEHPIDADLAVPVPDSANQAALGYWERMWEMGSSIRFDPWAFFRCHSVGRTFIEPVQAHRKRYLRLKFNPRPSSLSGKRVVCIDDSIVRSNTARRIVRFALEAGAKEVHFLVTSPMYLHPDFYGIDTYRVKEELVVRRCGGNLEAIRHAINPERPPDTLGYLTLDSTISAVISAAETSTVLTPQSFYTGPFTGVYPAGTGDFRLS